MKSKIFQDAMIVKSNEIYSNLKKEIDPDSKAIDLDRFKGAFSLFTEKKNVKLDENILRIINSFHVGLKIQKNDATFDEKISEKDFKDFLTCKDIKSLLFEKNSYPKKDSKDDMILLYTIMGGTRDGISLDNLTKNLSKVMDMYNDPNSYLRDISNFNSNSQSDFAGEAQEIIDFLGDGTDKITLKEFLNIMSNETYTDLDTFALEDYLSKKN